ncbi:MAG: polysaccharide biosynthesis/export family protein [Panacagrimonas sp.]
MQKLVLAAVVAVLPPWLAAQQVVPNVPVPSSTLGAPLSRAAPFAALNTPAQAPLGSASPGSTTPGYSRDLASPRSQPPAPRNLEPDIAQPAPPVPEALALEHSLSEVPVFGRGLFQGRFATESFRGFNPDYLIGVGDEIDVKLWGAIDVQMSLQVDAQGNIFVPRVGPVRVTNVRNGELNDTVQRAVRRVYREDVGVYATLAGAVPVKVFVSGFVRAPGLYSGFASDSILTFMDRAGGIDSLSGSYIDVRVLRGGATIASVNLYDFLTRGALAQTQLRDGDSVFVGPIGRTAMVKGLVASPAQFEFRDGTRIVDLLGMAGLSGRATHVSLTRNEGPKREVIYVPVNDPALQGPVVTGDVIEATADRLIGKIAVTLEGEHEGAGQYVLPYSATLGELMAQVKFSPQSQKQGMQLYRKSIAARQKQVLDQMLEKLEQSVLTARSATEQEAELRTREAQLVLQFVERARSIVPKGQVVLPRGVDPASIALEDGDVVRIPRNSQLVQVHGEVYLPNAFVWQKGHYVDDYVREAGGMIQRSSGDRVLLVRQSGEIVSEDGLGFVMSARVEPGDEILVLPAVDTKNFQFGKDVIQVIYQIAIAAGVLARL